jgi:hypothetical protein
LSITHQVEIGTVAGLSINGYHIHVVVDFGISGKFLSVETIDQELLQCGIIKPDFPVVGEEGNDRVLFIEIHRVDYQAEVVISFEGESGPLAKILLHVIEQVGLVVLNILLRVVPLIVWCNITRPE